MLGISKVHHQRKFALHANHDTQLGVITYLTDWTGHETEGYPGPQPAVFQDSTCTLKMENMAAVQLRIKREGSTGHTECPLYNMNTEITTCPMVQYLDGGSSRQSLSETDHAHVISILFQTAGVLVTAVQAGQAQLLILYPATRVTTHMSLTAGQLCILLHTHATITDKLWSCC